MSVRLIAVDIDGTLLDSRGNLPARNRRAVRRALDAGVHVVLATGRAFHHAAPTAAELADDLVLIVSNGALTKTAGGDTLASRLLPRATARAVLAALRPRHQGVAVIFDRPDARQYTYDGIDWSHPQRAWYYERNRAFMTRAEPIEAALTDDPVQVSYTGSVSGIRALEVDVRRLPAAGELAITLTEYPDRDFSLLDLTAAGSSKGAALAFRARRLGIDRQDVMAVGDNLNDREMLEFAGAPVVMGNAVAPLRARGWPLTAPHDECGLADAIERALAGDPPGRTPASGAGRAPAGARSPAARPRPARGR